MNEFEKMQQIANNEFPTKIEYLTLDEIHLDGGTQPRVAIDWKHVKLLETQIEEGHQLEPVVVFYDDEAYWLADGFHRWYAHLHLQEEAIACIVYTGSLRDAILYSVGTNADNKPALPRSKEDKRKSVITLLQDPEWAKWTDSEIAKRCHVNQSTVSRIRSSLMQCISENQERTYITKHGTTSRMNTTNIGKNRKNTVLQPGRNNDTPPKISLGNHVTTKDNHPLFPGQSGTIVQLPNPTSAIVELDNGDRALINLEDLQPRQPADSNKLHLAHHLKLREGVLVEIQVPNNSRINARLGIIANVTDCNIQVWVRDVERMAMHLHTLKHQQVEPVLMDAEPQLVEVRSRIDKLKKCNLDPYEVEIINLLERPVAFTPVELEYLAYIEKRHLP